MRPNILHIFTDQQRFDTIAALGNSIIRTPHLDRLVQSGVTFTNAYTPSPVCVAARCSMIHGLYPVATGCLANDTMPSNLPSLMDLLADAGYDTHGIGKCHFTPDPLAARGFSSREVQEEFPVGTLEQNSYLKFLVDHDHADAYEAHGVRSSMYYIPQPSRLDREHHPSQWIGSRSVAYIQKNQGSPKPWYLFSSFVHPHPPFTPPVPFHSLYEAKKMPVPNIPEHWEELQMFVNRMQNRYKYRDNGFDLNLVRCIKAYYYACISFVDFQIGRILDALEQTGQMANTLIVFCSDHGELLGDYRCFGKRSMHDASARIPLLLCAPDMIERGMCCDLPVSLIDLLPTFLEAAGQTSIPKIDGVSLFETLSGKSQRRYVYSMYSCYQDKDYAQVSDIPPEYAGMEKEALGTYMITDGNWKFIHSMPDNKSFLFDHSADPHETRNLDGMPAFSATKANLKHELVTYLRSSGLGCILDGDDFKAFPRVEIPKDPDAGLLVQDIQAPWFDKKIEKYTD